MQLVTFRIEAPGWCARRRSVRGRMLDRMASGASSGSGRCGCPDATGLRRPARSMTASGWIAGNRFRRPRHRRADGRHHRHPARHDGPGRAVSQPDPGGRMIDPITVEVIGSALASITEEMGEALIRASYSTNIKERRDCLDRAVQRARRHAVPGRAHPDASRQLHRRDRGRISCKRHSTADMQTRRRVRRQRCV